MLNEVVLATIGGLGAGYELFVTLITSRFYHSLIFTDLQALLMDHEMTTEESAPISANVAAVTGPVKSGNTQSGDAHSAPCQICGWKGHGELNSYNRYNQQVACSEVPVEGFVNLVTEGNGTDCTSM